MRSGGFFEPSAALRNRTDLEKESSLMPHITMETPHALGQEEAARRLKEKFSLVTAAYGSQVGDLQQEWNDSVLSFAFTAVGMKVSGTVAVEEAAVKMDAKVPLAAMMVRGMIEKRIGEELGNLLA